MQQGRKPLFKPFLLMKKFAFLLAFCALTSGAFAQDPEAVIGCWTMASRAGESIQLNRGGSFSFNDYNAKTKSFENLYGTWTMSGNTLSLLYEDRPKQRFTLTKTKTGWVMTKAGGFRFAKAQPADCMMEE